MEKNPKYVNQISLYVIWLLCAIRQLKEDRVLALLKKKKQVRKSVDKWLRVSPLSKPYYLLPHDKMHALR